MCGIIGYIGQKDVVPILVEGLKRLEYRGYDSAGIAVVDENQIHLTSYCISCYTIFIAVTDIQRIISPQINSIG